VDNLAKRADLTVQPTLDRMDPGDRVLAGSAIVDPQTIARLDLDVVKLGRRWQVTHAQPIVVAAVFPAAPAARPR
jgi:hypothetical protein